MSTFLVLCQDVARESGTISGTLPTSVTGQTGRLDNVINWTAAAWRQIQNEHEGWLWLREALPSTALTSSGTNRYTSSSWNLTRWGDWLIEPGNYTIYRQSDGVAEEAPLIFMDWQRYKARFERGTQTNEAPTYYSISPAKEFCLGPTPDATYVLNGEYRKAPQVLAANSDIPEMPSRFHDLIVWQALLFLAEFDEAPMAMQLALSRRASLMPLLERDQLPELVTGGPLA